MKGVENRLIYFIIFLCLAAGFFMLVSHKLRLPPGSTARGIKNAAAEKSDIMREVKKRLLIPATNLIAPFIRVEEYKSRRMAVQLERAEIHMTPEQYYARAIVMALGVLTAGGGAAAFVMPQMLAIAVAMAIVTYLHFFGEYKDKLKEKDKLIESELPRFVRAMVQGLKKEKDVIKLLETYETIAKKGLRYDIEVLIMDLKSWSFEAGMLEFDKRVGNAHISRLTKALISIHSGDNQDSTLNHLLSDMSVLARETMQRELNKRPGRVKMMVIPIVVLGVFTLFYVLGVFLFGSLSGLM